MKLIALLLVGALLVGCQTQPPPLITRTDTRGEVFVRSHQQNGLEINGIFNRDGTLDHSAFYGKSFTGTPLLLEDMRSAPTATGLIEVQATIRNSGRETERVQYRFRWLDAGRMEVGTASSGWQSETIAPDESRALRGVSREPGVESFQLFIRTYQPRK